MCLIHTNHTTDHCCMIPFCNQTINNTSVSIFITAALSRSKSRNLVIETDERLID